MNAFVVFICFTQIKSEKIAAYTLEIGEMFGMLGKSYGDWCITFVQLSEVGQRD